MGFKLDKQWELDTQEKFRSTFQEIIEKDIPDEEKISEITEYSTKISKIILEWHLVQFLSNTTIDSLIELKKKQPVKVLG